GQGQVDLDHTAAGLPVLDVAHEVVGQVLAADVGEERGLRVQRRDDHAGPDLLAVVQHHAGRPAALEQHPGHPGPGADGRAPLAALRIASAPAPIRPSWKPQLPRWRSPMSPMEWWAMT